MLPLSTGHDDVARRQSLPTVKNVLSSTRPIEVSRHQSLMPDSQRNQMNAAVMADKHRAQRAPKGQAGSTLVEISETLDNDVANAAANYAQMHGMAGARGGNASSSDDAAAGYGVAPGIAPEYGLPPPEAPGIDENGYGVAPGLAPEPFVMGDEAGYGVAPAAADGLAGLLGSDSDSEDDIEMMPESAHADTGNQYDALPDEMAEARANTLKKGMLPFSKHHVRLASPSSSGASTQPLTSMVRNLPVASPKSGSLTQDLSSMKPQKKITKQNSLPPTSNILETYDGYSAIPPTRDEDDMTTSSSSRTVPSMINDEDAAAAGYGVVPPPKAKKEKKKKKEDGDKKKKKKKKT